MSEEVVYPEYCYGEVYYYYVTNDRNLQRKITPSLGHCGLQVLGLHLTGSASAYSSCGVVRLNVAVVCHSCRQSTKQTNMKINVL